MWKNCVEEAALFCSLAPKKPWGFRGNTIMSLLFIFLFFMRIEFVFTGFFPILHHLRQLLLRSLVMKDKNVLSSKIKFRKSYWVSNKNNNEKCVIGWFFIILFSFSLSFIYASFIFVCCRVMQLQCSRKLEMC